MRFGVIADTHDRLPTLDRAISLLKDRHIDALIHAGDVIAPFAAKRLLAWTGPLHITYGNNDGERKGLKSILPQIQDGPLWVEAAGKLILVHHFIDWCDPADISLADMIVTGHTHEVVNERRQGKLYLNPGECCGWVYGKCTAAVLDTDLVSAEIISIAV